MGISLKKIGRGIKRTVTGKGGVGKAVAKVGQQGGKMIGKGLGIAAPFLPPGFSQAAAFSGSVLEGKSTEDHLRATAMSLIPMAAGKLSGAIGQVGSNLKLPSGVKEFGGKVLGQAKELEASVRDLPGGARVVDAVRGKIGLPGAGVGTPPFNPNGGPLPPRIALPGQPASSAAGGGGVIEQLLKYGGGLITGAAAGKTAYDSYQSGKVRSDALAEQKRLAGTLAAQGRTLLAGAAPIRASAERALQTRLDAGAGADVDLSHLRDTANPFSGGFAPRVALPGAAGSGGPSASPAKPPKVALPAMLPKPPKPVLDPGLSAFPRRPKIALPGAR